MSALEEIIAKEVAKILIPRMDRLERLIKAENERKTMNKEQTARYLKMSIPTFNKLLRDTPSFPKPLTGCVWSRGHVDEWLDNQ